MYSGSTTDPAGVAPFDNTHQGTTNIS